MRVSLRTCWVRNYGNAKADLRNRSCGSYEHVIVWIFNVLWEFMTRMHKCSQCLCQRGVDGLWRWGGCVWRPQSSSLTSKYTSEPPGVVTPECPGTSCCAGPLRAQQSSGGSVHILKPLASDVREWFTLVLSCHTKRDGICYTALFGNSVAVSHNVLFKRKKKPSKLVWNMWAFRALIWKPF